MSKKKAFWLLVFTAALLALAGFRVVPRVTIINQTGEVIGILLLEVSGQSLNYGSIPAGASASRSLRITRDSRFMVNYGLGSGGSARIPVGHIEAPAWWSRTRITVGTDGALDIEYD